MKFNFKNFVSVLLVISTLSISLVSGTGCSGDVGKWFEDQYKQLTCLHKSKTVMDAVPVSCLKSGKTKGIKCDDCGKIIEKQKYINPIGHKTVKLEAVPATCIKTGLTEGTACENCGEIFTGREVIPIEGSHNYNSNGVCVECREEFDLDTFSFDKLDFRECTEGVVILGNIFFVTDIPISATMKLSNGLDLHIEGGQYIGFYYLGDFLNFIDVSWLEVREYDNDGVCFYIHGGEYLLETKDNGVFEFVFDNHTRIVSLDYGDPSTGTANFKYVNLY